MKTLKNFYLIATILFGIATSAHADNDALELKLNVNTGEQFKITSKTEATFSCEGIIQQNIDMSQTYNGVIEVAGVDENQHTSLLYRLETTDVAMNVDNGISIKYLIDGEGGTMELVGFAEEPIVKVFDEPLAKPVTMTVTPEWEITSIDGVGFEQLRQMVASIFPGAPLEKLEQGQMFLSPFPKGSVAVGQEWDKSFEVVIAEDTPAGKATLHHLAMNFSDHNTLVSSENGVALIASKSDSFPKMTTSVTVEGVTYNLDFAISKEGFSKVNEFTGMTENAQYTLLISGEAEVQGMTVPFKGKIEYSLEIQPRTSA